MTLFIACILLWHFGAGAWWYVLACAVWLLHLCFHDFRSS